MVKHYEIKKNIYEDDEKAKDGDEGKNVDEEEEEKPSTSKTKMTEVNLDRGINEEYRNLMNEKGYDLPSKLLQSQADISEIIKRVENKINRAGRYIEDISTQKGLPLKKLSKVQQTTSLCNKTELP